MSVRDTLIHTSPSSTITRLNALSSAPCDLDGPYRRARCSSNPTRSRSSPARLLGMLAQASRSTISTRSPMRTASLGTTW